MTFGPDINVPIVGGGVAISADRFGNDYITVGGDLGMEFGLPPGAGYSEGYVGSRTREWGTGLAFQLNEAELRDAMIGIDLGASIAVSGFSLAVETGIPPQFQTVSYNMELVNLIGVDVLGASVTLPLPVDLAFTRGWEELDAIKFYSRGYFE